MNPHVNLAPSKAQTKVSMFLGQDEVLRANLPPLSKLLHRRAVATFLEALSLWTDARVCVALSAGDLESCFLCNLTDELGIGARSVFFAVEVVESTRKRGARIRGVTEFQKPHQLALTPAPGGEG